MLATIVYGYDEDGTVEEPGMRDVGIRHWSLGPFPEAGDPEAPGTAVAFAEEEHTAAVGVAVVPEAILEQFLG